MRTGGLFVLAGTWAGLFMCCDDALAARVVIDHGLSNGSFEVSSPETWQPFPETALEVPSDESFAYDGTHYARIVRTPGFGLPVYIFQQPPLATADGYEIRVSWWARAGTGSTFDGVTGLGPTYSFANRWDEAPLLRSDRWERYSVRWFMSSQWSGGPTTFGMGFYGTGNGTSPPVGYVDGVTVVQVPETGSLLPFILLTAAATLRR